MGKSRFSKKAGALFAVPDHKIIGGKRYERRTFNLGTNAKANARAKKFRKEGLNARVVTGTLQAGNKGYFVFTRKKK